MIRKKDITLEKIFPFLGWVGELKDGRVLRSDVIAGMTVFLVLVPQSMANAQLADLPPYYGLYAALIPTIVAALFGSSRQLSTGSVAIVSLMSAAAIQPLARPGTEEHIAYTVLLAAMVGAVQIGLGIARLGALVNLLSHPVVLGFTNAAAIIIGSSQIGMLFRVEVPSGGAHFVRVWHMVEGAAAQPHLPTVAIAAAAFLVMIGLKRLGPSSPWILVSVIVTTGIAWYGDLHAQYGLLVVGDIPKGVPALAIPDMNGSVMRRLFAAAVTVALIGFVGTISIAKAIAAQTRQRVGANRELIGQGLANILGSLGLSHVVSGSFVRSAVNFRAGAVTGFSSIVAGLLVLLTLLWLTPLFYHLPLATLAAIIVMAVIGLIRIKPIVRAWRASKPDGVVAVTTFGMTLIFAPSLETGILSGIALGLVLHIYRTMKPRIATLSKHPDGSLRDARTHRLETCEHICILRFDGSLYFGSAGYFEEGVLERVAKIPDLRYLILDAEGINQVDATGEDMLVGLVHRLQEGGIETYFVRTKQQVLDTLNAAGSLEEIGSERFFSQADRALQRIWERLNDRGECRRDCPAECPLNRARPIESVITYRV